MWRLDHVLQHCAMPFTEHLPWTEQLCACFASCRALAAWALLVLFYSMYLTLIPQRPDSNLGCSSGNLGWSFYICTSKASVTWLNKSGAYLPYHWAFSSIARRMLYSRRKSTPWSLLSQTYKPCKPRNRRNTCNSCNPCKTRNPQKTRNPCKTHNPCKTSSQSLQDSQSLQSLQALQIICMR